MYMASKLIQGCVTTGYVIWHLIDNSFYVLGNLACFFFLLLSADFIFKVYFLKKIFKEYHQSVK